jgi:hypothetical protein
MVFPGFEHYSLTALERLNYCESQFMFLVFLWRGPLVYPFSDCPYAIATPAFNTCKKDSVDAGQSLSSEAAKVRANP